MTGPTSILSRTTKGSAAPAGQPVGPADEGDRRRGFLHRHLPALWSGLHGLDCTGLIDWSLRSAGLHSDGNWYIGTNLTEVSQAEALPGDIALNDGATHVGLIVGRDGNGNLLVCHCSYGQNNVVVTEFAASGFVAVGRPNVYGE